MRLDYIIILPKKIIMKNKLLFATLLITAIAGAQNLNIPDANFKNKLLAATAANNIALDNGGDSIKIDANNDGEIQADEAEEVRALNVSASSIVSLQGIEGFTDLRILHCENNNIAIFDASVLADIRELYCNNNAITMLYLTGLTDLRILNCSYNELPSLDLNEATYLEQLNCSNNALETLFVKNGRNETFNASNWTTNTALTYICADEGQIDAIAAAAAGVTVTSNCTLEPGGEYNTIRGTVRYDTDNNCTVDDPVKRFVKVRLDTGGEICTVFTDIAGQYNYYTANGTYYVYPEFENTYFSSSPAITTVPFATSGGTTTPANFCVYPVGLHPDVEVVMEPVVAAAPGYIAEYKIVYKNKGNEAVSGAISCQWDPTGFTYAGIDPYPDGPPVPGNYTWLYTDLQPFESKSITMKLLVDPDVISVGQEIVFDAAAALDYSDDTPLDNTFTLKQKVVAAPEANNIVCIEGESAPEEAIGEYLHYVVNFTNTGTEMVNNIVIEQEIDPDQFDINTMEMLNSSHPVVVTVVNNQAKFAFRQAQVFGGGHGNILFKIKTRPNLQIQSTVKNQAKIYFEYEAPVETNEASTTFGILSNGNFDKDSSVKVYPNPTSGKVSISAESMLKSAELYDVQGRLLQTNIINNTTSVLDISGRATGIYFVKITSEKGVKVEKLIRQ